MEDRRPRERELILAPNEYAYILDTTKGHINTYVGPNKTSLALTDQVVLFDEVTKRFLAAELSLATALFPTAPANWYMVLKNPARDGSHPTSGFSNAGNDLRVGEKINVPGPVCFPLWPGQMARVIEGHRLRSNQYLYVRIYEPNAAAAAWNTAVGAGEEAEAPAFVSGETRIIRGGTLSFFIPPTGVEVVADTDGRYVRDAVALKRLEYCVLVGEDGKRQYVRGEAVVFPEPSQRLLTRRGADGRPTRVFRAIELSETTGVHVKVIAPYTDDEGEHVEGEELFITGRNRIYFPREEHAIVRYGQHELHQAVAIPRGEGRYVLDRKTGEVEVVTGPRMLLPDPRHQVITRRVLSDREVRLLYPNNAEALAVNRRLRNIDTDAAETVRNRRQVRRAASEAEVATTPSESEGIERPSAFVEPRTITIDNKYDGVVGVDVWSGYAVQVVDRGGQRRVVVGPSTVLLRFDETLAALSLSTGTPKSDNELLETAYLKVTGNKVSDVVRVVTSDLVEVDLRVEYRVSFEGDDPGAWFSVDNYVKLLCDHARSMIHAAARRTSVHELQRSVADIIRDALLGAKVADKGRRGMVFEENATCLYEVDVLDARVAHEDIEAILTEAQTASIERTIELHAAEIASKAKLRMAEFERVALGAQQETELLRLELQAARDAQGRAQDQAVAKERAALKALQQEYALKEAERDAAIIERELAARRARHSMDIEEQNAVQALRTELMQAQVTAASEHARAVSPQLVAALERLGDEQLLKAIAANFSELAAVEGRGLLETARKFMDFVPQGFMPVLASGAAKGAAKGE